MRDKPILLSLVVISPLPGPRPLLWRLHRLHNVTGHYRLMVPCTSHRCSCSSSFHQATSKLTSLGEESTLNYEGFGHTVVTPEMAGWLSNEFTTEADFHNLPKETLILNESFEHLLVPIVPPNRNFPRVFSCKVHRQKFGVVCNAPIYGKGDHPRYIDLLKSTLVNASVFEKCTVWQCFSEPITDGPVTELFNVCTAFSDKFFQFDPN